MLLSNTILGRKNKKPSESILRQKTILQNLCNYYSSKIKYLLRKDINENLLSMICKDSPFNIKKSLSNYEKNCLVKNCLKFYKKKLMETEKRFKKVNAQL